MSFFETAVKEMTPIVRALMARIVDGVARQAPNVEILWDDGILEYDDEGEASTLVRFMAPGKEPLDVTFTVTNQEVREGDGEGVGLLLSAVGEGGEVLAKWAPYNFSPKVWVQPTDPEPLAELRRRLGGWAELADNFAAEIVRE